MRYAAGTDVKSKADSMKSKGVGVEKTFSHAIKGATVTATPAEVEQLKQTPGVTAVQLDQRVSISQDYSPWGLDRSDQRSLPLNTYYQPLSSGSGVKAYIVDTGVRTTHVDFTGRVATGFTAINDGGGVSDCNGHGTHVAGTLAGTKYGMAKSATIVPVRVLYCDGSGYTSDVIAGLDWVTADHQPGQPAVINMSMAGFTDPAFDAAVQGAIDDGITVVAAAGNYGVDACTGSPARVPAALTVAATDKTDTQPSWSNSGSCVDLYAPGVSITSAGNASDTAEAIKSGTSMATPHVAGAVAVLLSQNPSMTPAQVSAAIISNATVGAVNSASPGTPNRLLYIPTPLALKGFQLNGGFGASLSGETYGLTGGGGYLAYQLGAIHWTPGTGAHTTSGSIRALWASRGFETGSLGYPVTDALPYPNGGLAQVFQGGSVYWTSGGGAHTTDGAIRTAWAATGFESGPLGYPVSDQLTYANGGLAQGFQGGAVYWTSGTGARATFGPIRSAWGGQGFESGPLGYPTTDVLRYANGGLAQGFQGGAIYWTAATGAHATSGDIRTAWGALGFESGKLGYPTTDVLSYANGGLAQAFQGGTIYWTAGTGAHATAGPVRAAWAAQGFETGKLGYPTTDETASVNGGVSQGFQGGAIYWTPTTGAHASVGKLRTAWGALGYENGKLGYPTTDELSYPNGSLAQAFQGGSIYWTSATGAHATSGPIRAAWAALGFEGGKLGYPTTDEMNYSNGGVAQAFQGGAIYWTSATGAHATSGPIRTAWASLGFETGTLGYPTSDETPAANGGTVQQFQGGSIYWSAGTGARAVTDPIRAVWAAQGLETGRFGYPASDRLQLVNGGLAQAFQGGSIYWTASTGAHTSTVPLRTAWAALGFEGGKLGYPLTDELSYPNGGLAQAYQGGSIYWTAATGAHATSGPIRAAWGALGFESGKLGYPVTDELNYPNGGLAQAYQGGSIYWTSATGAHATSGAIRSAWAAQGFESGRLGYPTTDEYPTADGVAQGFQGGTIYWTSAGGAVIK